MWLHDGSGGVRGGEGAATRLCLSRLTIMGNRVSCRETWDHMTPRVDHAAIIAQQQLDVTAR